MPKFKSILSRVILGKARQKEDGLDFLCAGFERRISQAPSHAYLGSAANDGEDDNCSITSISTTATADNLPGTGRMLDTYIYQPMGRRIERLAMRFTIASLHPAHIAQYIEADNTNFSSSFQDHFTLNDAITAVCRGRNGSTVVAGMKGLVKQTQSNSIYRTASALAALIRVSLTVQRKEIYAIVARIEPIFYLETLAGSHAYSDPEKKWFILLARLARETLVAVKRPSLEEALDPVSGKEVLQLWPSPETALLVRQRLKQALMVYRSSDLDSLEDSIGEACAICAEAVSTCIDSYARGDAYMHILETVYFTVIFLLRAIHKLANYAKITSNRHIYMVAQTLTSWIDAIVCRCLYAVETRRLGFDMNKLRAKMVLRSLVLVCGDHTCGLLPQSLCLLDQKVSLHTDVLPRRYREATEWDSENLVAQELIKSESQRTRRLLRSFDELEREAWGLCRAQTCMSVLPMKTDADQNWSSLDDFGDEWWDNWESTLGRARKVQVSVNSLTEEFRVARRLGLECDPEDGEEWRYDLIDRHWVHYALRRRLRHKWGQYLRSNMDWDWDLGTCMNHLFKAEKQSRAGPSTATQKFPAASPAIDVGSDSGQTWKIKAEEAHGLLPKNVKITYKTKDGKTQYMSFIPAPSNIPSYQSISETASSGTFGVEEEIETLATGAPSSDTSQPEVFEDFPVEAFNKDCEGRETAYDGGFNVLGIGGDAITVCSLD